jgi:formylglycine-generating enzyme required for sulfatase activity
VLDLAGSVSEWVEGHFEGDPRLGVLRGGSWARGPEVTRLCSREPVDPEDAAEMLRVRDRVGFRIAFDRS